MKPIRITALAAAFTMLASTAFAESISYNVEYDYLKNKFTVSGSGRTDGEFVTIQILKNGKDFDSFTYEDLLYGNQCTAENGEFKFNVEYEAEVPATPEASGVKSYNARLVTSKNWEDRTAEDFKIVVATKDVLEGIYSSLNSSANSGDKTTFNTTLNENIKVLTTNPKEDTVYTSEAYFNYVKNNNLVIDDALKNTKILNTFILIQKLNSKSVENINTEIEKTYFEDTSLKDYYKKTADTDAVQKYFTEVMSNKSIDSLDGFNKYFKQGIILTVAKYGKGYGELSNAVKIYGSSVGIDNPVSTVGVYKSLIGKTYANGDAFYDAYKTAVKNNQTSGAIGGGGNGGGGGGVSGNKGNKENKGSSVYAPANNGNSQNAPEIHVSFDDIEGVDWANEAIVALADKKIINGKEDNKFCPDDEITREEFVKILAGAMGYTDKDNKGNAFVDVNDTDWFCGWVNTAYEKGLVNGVGDGAFGVGQNISRQDMCVMLYNALKSKGVQAQKGDHIFADDSDIADYAKEAVNTLYQMQVVNGVDDTRFEPQGNATRAQAAKIIYAVLDELQGEV